MKGRTKGAIEAEIAAAAVRFQREQQGRGPTDARAYVIGDMVLIRCTGIFTATETHLSASEDGRKLIRSARQELRSIHRREAEAWIAGIVGCGVQRSYCDVDVEAAEQVEVYILETDIEAQLVRSPR